MAKARRLAAEFVEMLEHHDANALAPWLAATGKSKLKFFAAGIRRDYDAVLLALLFQWSNGQVEGQVNRVKLVKHTMYGRAGFALLRKRVLRAACPPRPADEGQGSRITKFHAELNSGVLLHT